jgi:1-acyl-sn-glycerol-3-phosphate acyltransferase
MWHIYIDRMNPGQSHHELEAVRDKFSAGSSVVFFPEGTRSTDGNLLTFKKGGFVISLIYGVPILPVTINGTREVLSKGSFMPMPGRIDVMIHPPVNPGEDDMTTKESLMERVREIILSAKR